MSCIVYVTGAVGTGKTTLCMNLLSPLRISGYTVDYISSDDIRGDLNDFSFSKESIELQNKLLIQKALESTAQIVFVDTWVYISELQYDYLIWVDTRALGSRALDTLYIAPSKYDLRVRNWNSRYIDCIYNLLTHHDNKNSYNGLVGSR